MENNNSFNNIAFIGATTDVTVNSQDQSINLNQLSFYKPFHFYPVPLSDLKFLFVIETQFLINYISKSLEITLSSENGTVISRGNWSAQLNGDPKELPKQIICDAIFKGIISEPGKYILKININGELLSIGEILFQYIKAPVFLPAEVLAIKSNPFSVKQFKIYIHCEFCKQTHSIYTSLERDSLLENKGFIHQDDLPEILTCTCGCQKISSRYMKESMHIMLSKDAQLISSATSYEQRYTFEEITKIVNDFTNLLKITTLEQPIQKFLENNQVMLSPFTPKKILEKRNILGSYKTDFILVDANGNLVFIELERPSLPLFTKKGQPTSALTHAYEQIHDWVKTYSDNKLAILNELGLKKDEITGLKCVIIAGRSDRNNEIHIRNHKSSQLREKISFLTLDDLANHVLTLARRQVLR